MLKTKPTPTTAFRPPSCTTFSAAYFHLNLALSSVLLVLHNNSVLIPISIIVLIESTLINKFIY